MLHSWHIRNSRVTFEFQKKLAKIPSNFKKILRILEHLYCIVTSYMQLSRVLHKAFFDNTCAHYLPYFCYGYYLVFSFVQHDHELMLSRSCLTLWCWGQHFISALWLLDFLLTWMHRSWGQWRCPLLEICENRETKSGKQRGYEPIAINFCVFLRNVSTFKTTTLHVAVVVSSW